MIDPTVRLATPGDEQQLLVLESEARSGLVEQRGGARWLHDHPERGSAWTGAIADRRVVVAHIQEVVVGYLVVDLDGWLCRVDEVYVTPDARELGFGDAMLDAARTGARERGATTLDGVALPGDRETKNLYERAGIKARMITLSVEL